MTRTAYASFYDAKPVDEIQTHIERVKALGRLKSAKSLGLAKNYIRRNGLDSNVFLAWYSKGSQEV